MREFKHFSDAVREQFNSMTKDAQMVYVVGIEKDTLWNHYMDAFPEGTNKVFRENREYECSTCKNTIRGIGGVVAIVDNKIVTIWDVADKVDGYYKDVTNYMTEKVRAAFIDRPFFSTEPSYGTPVNTELTPDGKALTWNHFSAKIPAKFYTKDAGSKISELQGTRQVFRRGLTEISMEAIDTVLDLITSNSLYRGNEYLNLVKGFKKLKVAYDALDNDKDRDIYIWVNLKEAGARINNNVIGELLNNLSEGKDLEYSVKAFETMVAPANYKRPTALITQAMIKKAQETIDELGIEESLHRRLAVSRDVNVNDVLWVNRDSAKAMQGTLSDLLSDSVKPKKAKVDNGKLIDIGIEDFIKDILPKAKDVSVLFEPKHELNLVTLVAPKFADAPNILQWDNNFTWSYKGNITDSVMKQNVQKAGGKVDGVLRFSIQWNDDFTGRNANDLDAHCIVPGFHEIYFGNKGDYNRDSSGALDIDITHPTGNVAVENIIFTDITKMNKGTYKFFIHNFSDRGGKGYSAELEVNGVIYSFKDKKALGGRAKETLHVVHVKYDGKGNFKVIPLEPCDTLNKEGFGIKSGDFVKLDSLMLSPNYWGDNAVGNKHYFFMLEGCKNDEAVRGFYNEFLSSNLHEHRKVFEILGSKMLCETSDEQLSGLGFSSTKRDELIVKVLGDINGTYKVKF